MPGCEGCWGRRGEIGAAEDSVGGICMESSVDVAFRAWSLCHVKSCCCQWSRYLGLVWMRKVLHHNIIDCQVDTYTHPCRCCVLPLMHDKQNNTCCLFLTRTDTHRYICTYIRTNVDTRTHTHTHTHTQLMALYPSHNFASKPKSFAIAISPSSEKVTHPYTCEFLPCPHKSR